ncbi:MAG: type II secretion system protein [Bacteroidota bacterium]|nr:type II secretion system protein [Bacteroidota bacterium]
MQKDKYLKGNTIIEVLIALAIISFCASLAVIIYLNIQKSSLPFFKIKAEELAVYYAEDALKNKTFTEETFKAEEFSIKKTVEMHPQFQDCYIVRVIVFDGNKKKLHELETAVFRQK